MIPFTSLAAVTSTGLGASRDLGDSLGTHTLVATVTGSPDSVNVELEGSHDGTNWAGITGYPDSGTGYVTSSGPLFRYVRANLTSLSGGTSPTVTATIASAP